MLNNYLNAHLLIKIHTRLVLIFFFTGVVFVNSFELLLSKIDERASNTHENSSLKEVRPGEPLPAWQKGMLDIHQINTGKGDAALFIFPDGTTFLLDAGALTRERPPNYDSPQIPNDSRRPGEWIVSYISAMHPNGDKGELDYAALTHFHGDHMGSITNDSPLSVSEAYRLTGITDVGEQIRIHTMIDRAWPDYNYPVLLDNRVVNNYRDFLDWHREQRDLNVEQFIAGLNDQIVLKKDKKAFPEFEIRNISVNGKVWTGSDELVRQRFPKHDPPSENNSSLSFRLTYGNFSYFNGGDLVGTLQPNTPLWRDMESALAWVVGPVDVHVLNHHGYRDAANPFFLSVLEPRIHILSVYAASHPGADVMRRLLSDEIYPGPRDIFLTNGMWEGRRPHLVDLFGEKDAEWLEDRIEEVTASHGHIVVRVEEGGDRYQVFVLDDHDENYLIKSIHGPFEARK